MGWMISLMLITNYMKSALPRARHESIGSTFSQGKVFWPALKLTAYQSVCIAWHWLLYWLIDWRSDWLTDTLLNQLIMFVAVIGAQQNEKNKGGSGRGVNTHTHTICPPPRPKIPCWNHHPPPPYSSIQVINKKLSSTAQNCPSCKRYTKEIINSRLY